MWNLVLIRLEMVLVSLQDRCAVCAKHTMAQKSFWMHQMVLLGEEAQVEVSVRLEIGLNLTQDRCTVCAERTICSETVLDAPMVLLGDEAQVKARFGLFRHSASLDAR